MASVFSMFAAEEAPAQVPGTTLVNASAAKTLFDEGVAFIDVRSDADFEAGRTPGAIHLKSKTTLSKDSLLSEVQKDEKIVFYCNGIKCKYSSAASKLAVEWGFTNVYDFRGGMPAWNSAGYSVE